MEINSPSIEFLTDKDKYTYVTVTWSTWTKNVETPHVEHFNVNLPPKEFIDRVVEHYADDPNKDLYFDDYASMELTDKFIRLLMTKYGIPKDLQWCFKIKLEKGQDRRIETLVY